MIMFCSAKHAATSLVLAVFLFGSNCIYPAKGSSFVIDDESVRTLDISPALGRGYSAKTNQFYSICIEVDETTEPSYNYDYIYTDVSSALRSTTNSTISGTVTNSFGWAKVKASVEAELSTSSNINTYTVMTTMRIERYYASVKENEAPLSADAHELLDRKDYVGFYKACGPNYVKSIRRAQEVTAMFTFIGTSIEVISEMKAKIKATVFGSSLDVAVGNSININSSMESLQIQIMGYGLSLDQNGSETLVATSLEDFNAAMRFAFSSMTRGNNGSAQTGMIYGIEFVPWKDNTAFQVACNLHETAPGTDEIAWTVPDEIIPNAVGPDGDHQQCANTGHEIDSRNKCCSVRDMKFFCKLKTTGSAKSVTDGSTSEGDEGEPFVTQENGDDSSETPPDDCSDSEEKVLYCQPVRLFSVDLLQKNLQSNGEHVAMMDYILQHKSVAIMSLERCIQVLRSFPESEDDTYLETPDSVLNGTNMNRFVTVDDLRTFLDPNNNMASVELLNMELDEYVDMYYNPCMAALGGMNIDAAGNSQPGDILDYIMVERWDSHTECKYDRCFDPMNSWNSTAGGCRPSYGQSGIDNEMLPKPDDSSEKKCAQEFDSSSGDLACKRRNYSWATAIEGLNECWKGSVPFELIERYCYPRLSDTERTAPPATGQITKNCKEKD